MMIPEFMRFYSYTASETLNEAARTFFGLINQMYRIQAQEALTSINTTGAGMAGAKDAAPVIDGYKKQAKGLHGIVEEVKVATRGKR